MSSAAAARWKLPTAAASIVAAAELLLSTSVSAAFTEFVRFSYDI